MPTIETIDQIVTTPQRRLKIASNVSRLLIGLTFIVSGITKVVDPWGTSLKIEEYFTLYGLDLLMPATMCLSIWLSSAEMMMGSMMLCRVRIRMVSIFVLFSISFFTILTFLSATLFPVEDCGCFGEVFHLTPWQSFGKNLLLLPFATVVFWRYRKDKIFNFNSKEICVAGGLFFLIFGSSLYSFLNLPLVDFLPYRKGVDLASNVKEYRDSYKKRYRTTLIYRNIASGELREFEIEDSEWRDTSRWEWIESRSNVEQSDDTSTTTTAIPFSIVDERSNDRTLDLISKGRVHIICITDFGSISRSCNRSFTRYIQEVQSKNESIFIITPQDLRLIDDAIFQLEIYNIDPIIMRNALRAKSGVIILNDGVVENKINCRNL